MSVFAMFMPGPLELIIVLGLLVVIVAVIVAVVVIPIVASKRSGSGAPDNPNLFPCPDCGNWVSRQAPNCPKCGRALTEQ